MKPEDRILCYFASFYNSNLIYRLICRRDGKLYMEYYVDRLDEWWPSHVGDIPCYFRHRGYAITFTGDPRKDHYA